MVGRKANIFDNMVAMMERYQGNLEQLVAERTDLLEEEKRKTEALLHRMLPKYVIVVVTSFVDELAAVRGHVTLELW